MRGNIPDSRQLAQLFAVAGVIARSVIKRTRVKHQPWGWKSYLLAAAFIEGSDGGIQLFDRDSHRVATIGAAHTALVSNSRRLSSDLAGPTERWTWMDLGTAGWTNVQLPESSRKVDVVGRRRSGESVLFRCF